MRRALAAALVIVQVCLLLPAPAPAQTTEADVYVAQAIVELDAKRYDAALENLRKALEIEPENIEALYYTGVVYMAQGRSADAVPFLQRARAKAPSDPIVALQLGLAYFARQDFDAAEPLLEQAFRANPQQEGLGYYVGFLRYRKKDFAGALRAFREGRTSDPELQQLTRLYTGLALAAQGLPAQAGAQVEEALRLAPGTAVTGPAERLRDAITAAREKGRRFFAEVRVGFFYDDNVAVVPNADTSATPDPLVDILRGAPHRSTGELFGARVEYVWWQTDEWDATVGYSFFGTYNNNSDLKSFNVMDHLATLGLTYKTVLGSMPLRVGTQYAFDMLFLDNREFVRRHTVTLSGLLVESERHLTQAVARYQRKDFNQIEALTPADELRSGNNWLLGATHLFRFQQDRHFISVGYQFDYEDTEGRNYKYYGNRLLAGGQYTLPWYGVRLKYNVEAHLRQYTNQNSLFPIPSPGTTKRSDQEIINVVRAEVPLPYNMVLTAEYQNDRNISNIAVFDFTRNVTSLTLSWSY